MLLGYTLRHSISGNQTEAKAVHLMYNRVNQSRALELLRSKVSGKRCTLLCMHICMQVSVVDVVNVLQRNVSKRPLAHESYSPQ